MCSHCKTTYKNYLLEHDPSSCPFQGSLYCSYCACYGHLSSKCPDAPPPALRFKRIGVLTPKQERVLEILDNEEVLKAFLQAQDRMPTKSVKYADLRKLVGQYASEKGRKLTLIPQ